jgi:hypothetical protein
MHAMRRHPLLLSRRLLPKAATLRPASSAAGIMRLLLSEADALCPVPLHPIVRGRLLSETTSDVLLARESTALSLPTGQRCTGVFVP